MSNVLSGINLQLIAQDSLTTLLSEFPLISKFSTNFGGDIAVKGESVTTRIASQVTATDIGANGYTPSGVVSTARTVTLTQHKGFVMGFNDGEVAKGGYDVLRRTFMRPAAWAVSKAVLDSIFALCTPSNFPNAAYNGSIAAFDADAVAGISQYLTDLNVPQGNRVLITRPAMYTNLAKDNAIQAQYASGTNAPLTENLLPRIHGFEVNQYSGLPNSTTTIYGTSTPDPQFSGLDANLMGIAANPESIIIAARLPAVPQGWYGNVATATDEKSGLSIQVREWYDGVLGQQLMSMSILYGVQIGSTNTLARILAS